MNRPSLSFQQLFQNKNDFVTKKSKIGIQTIFFFPSMVWIHF